MRAPVPPALAGALAEQQRRLATGAKAEQNALALGEGALAVVAGQQPGLLGGPLLSLHKAMGAIALAKTETQKRGKPVVPVFWVASEDHDWAEVNRAVVMDVAGSPRDLSLDVEGDLRSARDVPVPQESVDRLLEQLTEALPRTERAAAAIELVRPGVSPDLGSWFITCLARILGDEGLVFVEPWVLAPWAGETYARLVEGAEAIGAAVAREGESRRAKGLAAPLEPRAQEAPLFLRDSLGEPRRRVRLEGTRVSLRGEPAGFDRMALSARVREKPELASGDVVGRVFVQNGVLPVHAIVAGVIEGAYLEQIRAAHQALGLEFPQVIRRPEATWVERKTIEALEALSVPISAALDGTAKPVAPSAEADPLESKARHLLEEIQSLGRITAGPPEAATTSPALARGLGAAERELSKALAARHEEREARAGRGKGRFERAMTALRPKGEAQERVLSPVSILARHGIDAVRRGLSELVPGEHRVVRLD